MEELPADLMTKMLEFSSLPERLKLARCSTGLLRLITKEYTSLWVEIDFSREELRTKRKLSDAMLLGLLIRVNARSVTKSVNLGGCSNIKGWGLSPLCSSRILERINLRTAYQKFGDEVALFEILRTLVPQKLWEVRFNALQLTDTAMHFLFDLKAAKRQQAIEQRAACSSCPFPVAEEARQLVPNSLGFPSINCTSCHHQFCRMNSCPMAIRDCSYCSDASCEACDSVKQCHECKGSFCRACAYVSAPCRECKRELCSSCELSIECEDCKTTICRDCSGAPCLRCDGCDSEYCGSGECRKVEMCVTCQSEICFKCSYGGLNVCVRCGNGYCDYEECGFSCQFCKGTFCIRCNDFSSCLYCDELFCSDCTGASCSECWTKECRDCVGKDILNCCDTCGDRFCSKCDTTRTTCCSSCGKTICRQCNFAGGSTIFFTCNICHERCCGDCVGRTCSSCDTTCCSKCIDEVDSLIGRCSKCRKSFCNTCRQVSCCEGCNMQRCSTCCDMKECDKCSSFLCSGCGIATCDTCHVTLCDNCKNPRGKGRPSLFSCNACWPFGGSMSESSLSQGNDTTEPPKKKARRV